MSEHIVIIGAVALGPKAACRYKRLNPEAKVTMIDKADLISYGGCGIPYYVSGEVSDSSQLQTTTFHMVRDEKFFKETKDVDVLTHTEALRIDRDKKTVAIRNIDTGEEKDLEYDKLIIATGSIPRKLPIDGADLEGVHYVATLGDAISIREGVAKGRVNSAVIIGAGFIGLEMAEAFTDMWGIETTVVEIADQIMPGLVSPTLATMGKNHMEEMGVKFLLSDAVKAIEGEDGKVKKVVTGKETIEADLVIVSAGVIPNSFLAKDAGLEVSERGGIVVNEYLQTSDPDIYSGGDCIQIHHRVTGAPFYLPLGSMANRQGRIIGDNLHGGHSKFHGAVGSFTVKMFERTMSGTGLSLAAAKRAGIDAISVTIITLDRAHFFPKKDLMTLELVVEKSTRRILGMQGFAEHGDTLVGKVNTVAVMLPDAKVEDICQAETAYSPPYASAMDILNTLGNVADNTLHGHNKGVLPEEFVGLWEQENGNLYFLDCREEADAKGFLERYPEKWHNIPQGKIFQRSDEIPRDKSIVLMCNTGARSYEAQINLAKLGINDVRNLYGGMALLKKWGCDL